MDFNKINKELNKFDYDDFEISNECLSEFEIEKMMREGISRVKKRSNRKKYITAASVILLVGTFCTPVVAENIPILSDVYERFGIIDEYQNYKEYIGASKIVDNYTITMEEIALSETQGKVLMSVFCEDGIEENITFNMLINAKGAMGGTSSVNQYLKDENTLMLEVDIDALDGEFKLKQDMNISVNKIITGEEGSVETIAIFDIRADFRSMSEKENDIKLNASSSTNNFKSLSYGEFGAKLKHKEKNPQSEIFRENLLKVDGKVYAMSGSSSDGKVSITDFPSIDKETIDNANSIEIIETFDTDEMFSNIENKEVENIICDVSRESSNGGIKLEDIERDGKTLRFIYSGKYATDEILGGNTLWEIYKDKDGNETYGVGKYGVGQKVGDKYILEYHDINTNEKYKLSNYYQSIRDSEVTKLK